LYWFQAIQNIFGDTHFPFLFFKGTYQQQQKQGHGERVATLHIFTRGRKLFFTPFFSRIFFAAPLREKHFVGGRGEKGRSIAGDSLNFFHSFRSENAGVRYCGLVGVSQGGALNARNDNKNEINFMHWNGALQMWGGGMTNKIQEHLRIRRTHKINEVHAITCTLLLTGIHHVYHAK